MVSLFTDAESESMINRLNGGTSDPTGIFSHRVRPKLTEIYNLTNTAATRKKLKQLLIQKRNRNKISEPAKPCKVQSFKTFRDNVGY